MHKGIYKVLCTWWKINFICLLKIVLLFILLYILNYFYSILTNVLTCVSFDCIILFIELLKQEYLLTYVNRQHKCEKTCKEIQAPHGYGLLVFFEISINKYRMSDKKTSLKKTASSYSWQKSYFWIRDWQARQESPLKNHSSHHKSAI